jgi:hypothetical protein
MNTFVRARIHTIDSMFSLADTTHESCMAEMGHQRSLHAFVLSTLVGSAFTLVSGGN